MPDLITLSRATQNPTLAGLNAANPGYLASLISAAGDAVRRECRREFTLDSFTEYHSGGIYLHEPLRLREFPVLEITRVAAGPRAALFVQNLDPATNQRATVETTSTGVRLARVASAVGVTIDLPYATYPTIAALAGAINAAGGGWSAMARGDFGQWPSADFKPLQGAVSVLAGGRELELYSETVQPFAAGVFSAGEAEWEGFECSAGWRLDAETGELFGRFPRGQLNIRLDYRAGFSVVPQAVQEAAVQLAADLYQAGLVNNTLKKATLGASSVELKSAVAGVMSPKVQMLLAPYRDFAKTILR